VNHGIDRLAEDDAGWWMASCECGWVSPACPDKATATEVYGDHLLDERPFVWDTPYAPPT
jgi:hypothetical protein